MSGPTIPDRDLDFETRFGAEIDDFGAKLGDFVDGKWRNLGNARSTQNQANPWIKINKTSSNQQITKKIGGYFWWGFSKFREEHNKVKLENEEGRL